MPSFELVELGLRHTAVRAHAIAPQPAGGRQLQVAGERAVVGEQQQPSLLKSRRPTEMTRGSSGGRRVEHRRAPLRVAVRGDEAPAACDSARAAAASAPGSGLPSTRILSLPLTSKAGVFSTLPLTLTRPSPIQRSASRREHRPARAIALAMRRGPPSAAVGRGGSDSRARGACARGRLAWISDMGSGLVAAGPL